MLLRCVFVLVTAMSVATLALAQQSENADALSAEATRLYKAGKFAEAIPVAERALALREKALGPDHPTTGTSLNNLALINQSQGRYGDAERLYRRALTIFEKKLGRDHPRTSTTLNNLAELYRLQGRLAQAEPFYKRALAIFEVTLGSDHPRTSTTLNNLALLYMLQDRYVDAEPLFKRALAIAEKALGPDHPTTGTLIKNLAQSYLYQDRYAQAEPLLKRALAIFEKALGRDHPRTGNSLGDLASLYQLQGRFAQAEALHKRALATAESALGPDHPGTGTQLNNLAALYFAKGDWRGATNYYRRGTALIARRSLRGTEAIGRSLSGKTKSEAARSGLVFPNFVKSAYRHVQLHGADRNAVAGEMFGAAQWVQSTEASASLARMAARAATGSPDVASIVRERQDLVTEWQAKDKQLLGATSRSPAKRNAGAEQELRKHLVSIETRIGRIDKRLAKDFPDYAALANPQPLTIPDIQRQLRDNEVFVLFFDTRRRKPTPEETFIWVITKTAMRWVRSELGSKALKREVAALRCGLDYYGSWVDKGTRCYDLTGHVYTALDRAVGKPLPFDTARAHKLYKALFGEVEDLLTNGKRLLIVPSGPLTQLPFQVLVTQPLKSKSLKEAAWLARRHAITVLPAVSSLKALRAHAKTSRATKPFAGFGNPLLDGDRRNPWHVKAAEAARNITGCAPAEKLRTASLRGRRGVAQLTVAGTRLADTQHIRAQAPLPETADELCRIARSIGADADSDILLGSRATEAAVKQMNADDLLKQYKVISFSTHGAMAGELRGGKEPGLILTPPDQPTETDDGYLTASEIAGLKLDADWVLLSACNTAAGQSANAEALGGLARAFFYAGARSLLVSHWSVNSSAAVALVTNAFLVLKADPEIGRSEAMRRSMLALIEKGGRHAHPGYWAPFVVVGEGGAT